MRSGRTADRGEEQEDQSKACADRLRGNVAAITASRFLDVKVLRHVHIIALLAQRPFVARLAVCSTNLDKRWRKEANVLRGEGIWRCRSSNYGALTAIALVACVSTPVAGSPAIAAGASPRLQCRR